ncbi:MAG: flagellar M-ring protein FliF [Burkholderiales bacterium]|nr:flagellar M-ring protein FliF [Burkholderiales bacterium]
MEATAPANAPAALPQPTGVVPQFARLPIGQKLSLMLGAAAAVAIVGGAWLYAREPDWRVLFGNLSDRDGGATIAALSQLNVPYKFADGGGAILVPADRVHEMRLRLASQGLPKGGTVGFELVDNQKFGATQFQEQINYQRGLEGELARSIQSRAAVASARVHLAIPKPSVFVRDTQTPTASVLLTLHAGRTLDRAQIAGIVHLVASSVPQLNPDSVNVIDQNGALLSQRKDGRDGALDANALDSVRQIEQATIARIVDILEPIVGRGNARVQVTADVDFSRTEQVAETFKPNADPAAAARRQLQLSESTTSGAAGAAGVPGALSNQPPPTPTAPIDPKAAATTAAQTAASGPVSARKDESVAFEVDKTIQHTRAASGQVKRLTAAVVVNHKRTVGADGKAAYAPLPAEDMEKLSALVREAMGFSKERGDSLNVVNAAFSEPERVEVPELPLWKQPDTVAMAKDGGRYLLFALLIAYLVFGVLRPALRRAAERVPLPPPTEPALTGQHIPAGAQPQPPGEDPLARARRLAREDPKIVANVVKSWVGQNG